jgi:hypothetical protein
MTCFRCPDSRVDRTRPGAIGRERDLMVSSTSNPLSRCKQNDRNVLQATKAPREMIRSGVFVLS